jgi:hypothetical protein
VDEHDRLLPLLVGAVNLLLFMDRENGHIMLLWMCRLGQSVRLSRSLSGFSIPGTQCIKWSETTCSPGDVGAVRHEKVCLFILPLKLYLTPTQKTSDDGMWEKEIIAALHNFD